MLKKVIREKDKEKLDMNVFKELGKDLNYKDILQVDGAFSACHINYGKSLKFNGADSKNMRQMFRRVRKNVRKWLRSLQLRIY